MQTVKEMSRWISKLTAFCLILIAILVLIMNPNMYVTQTYTLIHWLGIGLLIIIVSMKVSSYAGLFMNPKKALAITIAQLICLPFIINILINYFHIPTVIAMAIALALLTPNDFSKNLFKNLFLAAAMFFVSWYTLPAESVAVNKVYATTTSSTTKIALLVIALGILAFYEFKRHQIKKQPLPNETTEDAVDVYYVDEKM